MRKTFMTLFLFSACSLMLAAQSQDQMQTDQQNTPSSSRQMDQQQMNQKSVTLTGCLQPGTDPNTYILSGVTPSDMNDQSSESQGQEDQDQSQSGNMPSELARGENTYTLIPDGRVDLRSHVGQRVEVTGKIMESTSRMNQSSRATTPSGQSSTMHSQTEMTGQPQFRVSSIRQISDSCQ